MIQAMVMLAFFIVLNVSAAFVFLGIGKILMLIGMDTTFSLLLAGVIAVVVSIAFSLLALTNRRMARCIQSR